jgi:hypothetical protein
MKILFLDIDGVLNSARSFTGIGKSYPTEKPEDANLDPVAVGLLKAICREGDFKIFIHSSWWGLRCNKNYATAMFAKHGWLTPGIIGGSSDGDRKTRIDTALAKYKPENYIILDDCDLREYFGSHAIVVNPMNGLSMDNYANAMKHLGKNVGVFLI